MNSRRRNPYPVPDFAPLLSRPKQGDAVPLYDRPVDPRTSEGLEQFLAIVQSRRFPCIGAKQAVGSSGTFGMSSYEDMRNPDTAKAIAHDVIRFLELSNPEEMMQPGAALNPSSFAAYFPDETFDGELAACRSMLTLVKNLNDQDTANGFELPSEPAAFSRDAGHKDFAVFVGGHPFFTAFFHPEREARSPRKTNSGVWVNFNSHHGFYYLKAREGVHERWLDVIRGNITKNYGEPHADLVHHGLWSEVMQYLTVSEQSREEAIALIAEIFGLPEDSELFVSLRQMRETVHQRAVAAGCPYHMQVTEED